MLAANTLFYRVTEQKTPSGKVLGWNVLGGFDPKLTYKTAAYRETALDKLTTEQLEFEVAKMASHANASSVQHVSSMGMFKKLAKNDEAAAYA